MGHPIRVLVAKPGLDGHDRGALVIAQGLRDEGMEVIYTGLRQTPAQIVATAIQEDVQCIGLSSLSGAHMELFPLVADLLRREHASDILLVGGGIIPESDVPLLKEAGVAEVFGPGAKIEDVAEFIRHHVIVSDPEGFDHAEGTSSEQTDFSVQKVDHIGIAVNSIVEALPFYTAGLGLAVSNEEIIPSQKVRTVFLTVGETHLELLEPTAPDSPIAKFLDKKGPGIHHIAYAVPDVEAALNHARALGYRLIDETAREGGQNKLIAFVHPKASNGVLTEFCQPTTHPGEGESP